MPEVRFFTPTGSLRIVDVATGQSVMDAAVRNGIDGIVAECGGSCACATCHVYVDEQFLAVAGRPGVMEDEMLEGVASPRTDASRLSCQIKMRDELHGIIVKIAQEQL
ncbi:2Fe-2S iron-sulfur cluster binding domain-containing protein [Microbacterium lacus]|uniref:2Fe-2S iron-sulfur cluster-binding protein n=1 Tax=Microbacterium lacus TaxID=415217 RepID=UPI00384FB7C8